MSDRADGHSVENCAISRRGINVGASPCTGAVRGGTGPGRRFERKWSLGKLPSIVLIKSL